MSMKMKVIIELRIFLKYEINTYTYAKYINNQRFNNKNLTYFLVYHII